MPIKTANSVQQLISSVSGNTINLGAATTGNRTLAAAIAATGAEIAVGSADIAFRAQDDVGNWKNGKCTLTTTGQVTQTSITASSAAGADVTLAGTVRTFSLVIDENDLNSLLSVTDGIAAEALTVLGSLQDSDLIVVNRGGSTYAVTGLTVKTYAGGAPDTTAPAFVSAQVANGAPSVIVLTFNETLAAFTPAAAAFSVSGGKTVSSVARSGATISLTVNSAYAAGASITATYVKPGTNAIQDGSGNQTNGFGPVAVTNNIASSDTTPPTLVSAAVANSTPTVVNLTMSEGIDPSNIPVASSFTVSGHTVSSVAVSGSMINLTCSAAFVNGEAARTVSYTAPGTANIRDLATPANQLANFSGQAITNNVAAASTMAALYTVTTGVNFPTTAGFDGGSAPNQYWAVGFNVYIKDSANAPPPGAESTIQLVWGISPTTPPIAYSGGAWPSSAPYAANGGNSGSAPNSVKFVGFVNSGSYPNLFGSAGTLYGGGSAGTYYLHVLFPDGSSKACTTGVVVA